MFSTSFRKSWNNEILTPIIFVNIVIFIANVIVIVIVIFIANVIVIVIIIVNVIDISITMLALSLSI